MFGKIMSISDELMWRYYELLSFKSASEIGKIRSEVDQGANPRDAKFALADEIIARFHSQKDADSAREKFVSQFSKGAVPDDMPEVSLALPAEGMRIANLLKEAGLVNSTSEGMRMIKQGAVKIGGEKAEDTGLVLSDPGDLVIQVGKRKWARVTLS